MSRNLKRVPLDFEWPLNQIWRGYKNPYSEYVEECRSCEGSGMSPDAKFLSDMWYKHLSHEYDFGPWYGANIIGVPKSDRLKRTGWGSEVIENLERIRRFGLKIVAFWADKLEKEDVQALVDSGRLHEFTDDWSKENGWKPKDPPYVPTPDEVNEWAADGMGHDSINQWTCVKARCKKFGIKSTCEKCKGEGQLWASPEMKEKSEKWKPKHPPKGEGFQLWEDVDEGSPVSPVFATLDELCEWSAENATTFANKKASKEDWKKMLEEDNVHHREGNNVFM